MKITLNRIAVTLVLVLLTGFYYAQAVYSQVSSKKVQVGTAFEYALVITVNANSYTPPSFKDLEVAGPFQSSMTQIINGVQSSQTTLSWSLLARKEGKYTIGPAVVVAGSQKYETAPITIEVTKGAAQTTDNGPGSIEGDIFVKTIPTKTKLYVGEQLVVTHKIFSRHPLVGPKKHDLPQFDGFWTKRIEITSPQQQENIDGVIYYTAEYDKNLLYATAAGKKALKIIEPSFIVRKISNRKPRSFWEQFLGGQQYEDLEAKTRSSAVTIDVLPLPEEGKPASFNGAVGKLNYKVETNTSTLKANEALNLKISISGNGNFPLIDAPKLNLPEDFEAYDPKVNENGSSKTFDYLIIPRSEGEFVLNDLEFSYFNSDTKKYTTIPSPEIKIKVLPPDPNSTGAQVYTPQNTVKETENDIRYIKKGNFQLSKTETEFFNSAGHLTIIFGLIGLLITGLILRRNHLRNNSDLGMVRERKAARVAKKQLAHAEKLMQQNKKDEFYTEVLNAINSYLGHKLHIPVADLSRETIQKTLLNKHVDGNYIIKVLSTIETSEYAKYAPGAVSGDLKTVYNDTVDLVTGLESQLNKKA